MKFHQNKNESGGHGTTAQAALQGFLDLIAHPLPLGGGHGDFPPLVKRLWFAFQRQRAAYDWLLAKRCRRLDEADRRVLWWALAECYALDGLPPAVAVDTAVDYTARRRSRASASFVNAVLRGILRQLPDRQAFIKTVAEQAPPPVQAGLPNSLYERWRAVYGAAWLRETAALLQEEAPVTARLRGCFKGDRHGRPYPSGGVFTVPDGPVDFSRFYLQDPSTILAPLMLAPSHGDQVADLCAAPGGKSLIIAELLDGTGHLHCCDRADGRMEALCENLAPYANVTIACADAAAPGLPPNSMDGVLLDVPCSNTGVIRRRPDVRWNYSTAGLKELLAQQRRILEGAARLPKVGGVLIYSTCSIEPEENDGQVRAFLKDHPEYTLEAARQLLPTRAHDGAYAARLRRKGDDGAV